jgi:transposase
MARFGSSAHLASWVGVAPGNNASAGKPRYGRTGHGDQALRTVLTQLAHTAARTKGTYLSALSHRLATCRRRRESNVAVAHAQGTSIVRMLMRQELHWGLGANCFDEQRRHTLVDR